MEMRMKLFYLMFMAILLSAMPAVAAEPGQGKLVLDLKECVRKALDAAPELGEARADIAQSAAKLDEAKAYRLPQIEIIGLTGPVPQARGNQVASPDSINQTERWTWFERGDATLIQPLYTFGKIAESMKAAGHGIEVERARQEQRRGEIALKVKEYYFGLLLARELKEVLLEVREDIAKAREKAVKLLDQGSPNVEEMDIYKLDTFDGEVAKYLEEAAKGEALALTALRSRLGLPAEAGLEIAAERLIPAEAPVPGLDAYLETSRAKRPEYRQIREGLQAREALVEAARAGWYPDIFLAGYLSAAHAEKRERVTNPWVLDQFNHTWGGVALGLKWKLDFGITGARVAGERAQYERLLHTRDYAETNIPLQIRKFHLDLNEAERSMTAARKAYTNAKKWAVAAIANFDFGIGPAKEIFDALQEYAKMRAAYFQSIYNYNLARASLDYAAGEEPL